MSGIPLAKRVLCACALALALATTVFLQTQCSSSAPSETATRQKDTLAKVQAAAAWEIVYSVLEHPRCMNCHPAGDRPLQGDASKPHAQNVLRGPDGEGLYALRCANCHLAENQPGPSLPPGAPGWHLPRPEQPLVFEGLSSAELCRQLADPQRNGNRTPEELLQHVAADPLVLWGWKPGDGREPVPVAHESFVAAMRTWVEADCACPE